MPHLRDRYAYSLLKRALTHSPIVGVFGQRQVGKTTLVESVASEYRTLDQESTRLELEADPELFLKNRPLKFSIDEAQLSPRLFPALKEQVRNHKKPGQFILSGSVRFTSRAAIRESLTGRISTVEILPFSNSEANEEPLPDLLVKLTKAKNQKDLVASLQTNKRLQRATLDFEKYLNTGGLPGIAFFRSPEIRTDHFESQIDSLLNRDLRLVQNTTLPYSALRGVLEFVAKNQGVPFEIKEAVRATQVSAITIKRLLFAFEALFLVRQVECVGDLKRPTYFLEDQGFASWISRRGLESAQDLVRGLYANLRQELHYRPELNGRIYQFRTKHDVEIPLVFDSTDIRIGVITSLLENLNPKTISSAQAFLKKFPDFKIIIAYGGHKPAARSENLFLIPFWMLI